jgi:hypothetical protein
MRSEVKGVWFVTARRYLLQDHGEEAFARYVDAAPESSREALREPVVSRWYAEEVMRDALTAFHSEIARGDDAAFSAAMERCAVLGVHWFFQLLASVATPRYLLRLFPAVLKQARRGPVRLAVDVREREATLRFTHHPYANDPRYRLATPAIVRAVLSMCVGQGARATLTDYDETTHVCEVTW